MAITVGVFVPSGGGKTTSIVINPDGTYKPQVASYQTLVSASNYQTPGQDQQKGIYKRLYSNLPLLLKSKGTNRFNQYLNY
jgi:hypothetical protein